MRILHTLLFLVVGIISCIGQSNIGEYGSNLDYLKSLYFPPKDGESNHYFEMWDGQQIRNITKEFGLTNNNTLFIDSHGNSIKYSNGKRHAYIPHDSLKPNTNNLYCYSIKDMSVVMGESSKNIHNIIISGCDLYRTFNTLEVKKYFINVTNVSHVPAGELGYQPMYYQSFLSPSKKIIRLYEQKTTNSMGKVEYHMKLEDGVGYNKLSPYVSDIFLNGSKKPYRTQISGIELLVD